MPSFVGQSPQGSWVAVCNAALRAIGAQRISNLADGTPSQQACSDLLGDAITAVTSASDNWAVLRKRVQLAIDATATPPVNDYLYAYLLPVDCVDFIASDVEAVDAPPVGAVVQPPPGRKSNYAWIREDRWILTNATLVYLTYARDVVNTDAATLPDWFLHAIHDQLAVALVMPLRQNPALLRQLTAHAAESLRNAIANDDKMKDVPDGEKTRGYRYYEETRMTGFTGDYPDPYRQY